MAVLILFCLRRIFTNFKSSAIPVPLNCVQPAVHMQQQLRRGELNRMSSLCPPCPAPPDPSYPTPPLFPVCIHLPCIPNLCPTSTSHQSWKSFCLVSFAIPDNLAQFSPTLAHKLQKCLLHADKNDFFALPCPVLVTFLSSGFLPSEICDIEPPVETVLPEGE